MKLRRIFALTLLALGLAVPFVLRGVNVAEAAVVRGSPYVYFNAINDTITPMNWLKTDTMTAVQVAAALPYTAESTAVFSVRPGENVALLIRLRRFRNLSDSLTIVRFAVQLRAHLPYQPLRLDYSASDTAGNAIAPSDSASIFPITRWSMSVAGSNYDSTHTATSAGQPANYVELSSNPTFWNGTERLVVFRPNSDAGKAGGFWQNDGTSLYVPLYDIRATPVWAPYMSVRIRCLSGGAYTANGKPRITVHVLHYPATSGPAH